MKPDFNAAVPSEGDLIKIRVVQRMVALSRSAVYAEMKRGNFPKQVRQTARSVAWRRSEVQAWVDQRKTHGET